VSSTDFSYDLVTLRHFEAGEGWDGQLRHLVRSKYRQHLAGLVTLDPLLLARLLGGEVLPSRPYATVQWVLELKPFRPLELYFLLDSDPEFGTDLRIFYSRKSLAVPTEDAYVFAWDYLALLARYGRGEYPLQEAAPASEWLPFTDFAAAAGPLQDVSLGGPREELLRRLTPEVVEVAVRRLDRGASRILQEGWEVVWRLLGDLAMRLQVTAAGIEVAFDRHGARKYAPEFLMSFAWLFVNALLRECRQVDPSLPRLSRYF
jgi:hypothetical protein